MRKKQKKRPPEGVRVAKKVSLKCRTPTCDISIFQKKKMRHQSCEKPQICEEKNKKITGKPGKKKQKTTRNRCRYLDFVF